MIRDLIKWVVPGLATVLGGTTLCLAMTSAGIDADLAARSADAMRASGYDWAEIALDGRDLTLTGTTTDANFVAAATTRLEALPGIRSVRADVTMAPLAQPYRLQASIDAATVALTGGVPDDATRQRLLTRAGLDGAPLDLRSGMPERRAWIAGAEFAIDQLKYLDQGHVTVTDLTVDITGRAASERAFRDLLIVMRAGAPAGVTLGDVAITPALASPYVWNASFDGTRIDVSGYVPDETLADRYRTAEVGGAQVATGLSLGSGEPAGFADLSQTLLEQLARLEYGAATISDGESTLTGAPATLEIAQGIVDTLEPSGTVVVLEPPRIDDYWMSVTRQPGGLLVFDGYAPDEVTREALAAHEGADTTWLKLGRGAPERYHSAVDFGLAALALMSEGRFALRDNVVTLNGVARSGADYEALRAIMAEEAPQGLVLARAELAAPRAERYEWSATKTPAGAIVLGGLTPSPEAEAALTMAAGNRATSNTTYASGEPTNFLASATTGITLLQWLSDGRVEYDGSGWLLTGTARSPVDKGAIEADFVTRQLAAAGWSMAVATPAPTIPVIEPYTWSAEKTEDGHVTLSGHVPAESLKRYLAVHAGDDVSDTSQVGSGAPDDFVAASGAALDAVLALEEGRAQFDGRKWTLTGDAASVKQRDALLATLATAVATDAWSISVTAPEPIEPAPVEQPASEPPAPEPAAVEQAAAEPAAAAQVAPAAELAAPTAETAPLVEPTTEPPTPSPAVADPAYAFSATRAADGTTILSGQLPADPALRYFGAITGGDTAAVSVAAGAPQTFLASAETGLRALILLTEGQLDFSSGAWFLRGMAPDATVRDAVFAALGSDAGGATWTTDITVPEPAEPAIEPAAEPAPAPVAAADIAACAAPLADFSARNAILFQSGAAIIAAESQPALDELAVHLAACPDAMVHVEGHTDTDGDESLNLALSVARAEAVVGALVERGVAPARLYAIGYGESQPIADNATAAGKRLNRRIVVTLAVQQ